MSIDELSAELTKSFESALVDDWMADDGRKAVSASIAEVLHAFFDPEIARLKPELAEARRVLERIKEWAWSDGWAEGHCNIDEVYELASDFLVVRAT